MASLAKGLGKKTGANMVAEIIGIMFMSRTYAHMAHLKTGSFAAHKALDSFYDCIVGKADSLAEASQGLYGKLDIPYVGIDGNVMDPISALESHIARIKTLGRSCDEPYLENILQEIEALYRSTLYLLKELK